MPSLACFRKRRLQLDTRTTSFFISLLHTHTHSMHALFFLLHAFNPLERRRVGLQPMILFQLDVVSQLELGSENTHLTIVRKVTRGKKTPNTVSESLMHISLV